MNLLWAPLLAMLSFSLVSCEDISGHYEFDFAEKHHVKVSNPQWKGYLDIKRESGKDEEDYRLSFKVANNLFTHVKIDKHGNWKGYPIGSSHVFPHDKDLRDMENFITSLFVHFKEFKHVGHNLCFWGKEEEHTCFKKVKTA